jgi:hypothetical protein
MSISQSSSTQLVQLSRLILVCSLATGLISACSSSFQTSATPANSASNAPGGDGSGQTPGGKTPQTPSSLEAWKQLDVSASLAGGAFAGVRVLDIDKDSKDLILRLPMPLIGLDGTSVSIPIDKIPGAKLSLEPLARGGSALALRIPLKAVIRGDVQLSDPTRLPNGDKLPGVPSGEAPSTAVEILKSKKIAASVYLSKAFVGLYVNTPFDPTIGLQTPFRNGTRTWGMLTTVPAKGDVPGGFFISVQLPSDVARIIDDML